MQAITVFFFGKDAQVVAMELATYKIVDQSEQNSKRSGVFIKYKIIAITAVVLLVVVTALVLLAAFLGPGRKKFTSVECSENSGETQASAKSGEVQYI